MKEEKKVITFDFDDTLALSHWDEDIDWWVHDGPQDYMMKRFSDFKEKGYKVYIVTSRHEDQEDNTRPTSTTVADFVQKHNLQPDGIYFTNGQPKIKRLLSLGSAMHHDDDPGDILDARANGIKAVISDPYGDYQSHEASEMKLRGNSNDEDHIETD
tara:strand:- start:220 stop:690 length:471 start_codon:yes stop_codon:yes gene_type:complete